MSSFAPGTSWEEIDRVNKQLYGATRDPQPYNPPANANLAGVNNMRSLIGSLFGNRMQGGHNQLPSNAVGSVNFGGSGDELPRPIGVGMALPGGLVPGSQVPMGMGPAESSGGFPGRLDDILRVIGVPPTQPLPSMGVGGGGIGGPIGVTPPMPPRGGPVQSLPLVPPQMPVAGMTPAPTPPQMPIRAVEDPYSTTPDLSPGMQRPPAQGLDVQKLLAMLRAMQSRRQPSPTPQPPQGREGTPRMGPSPMMRGSGMGLEGILRGIEASRSSR